MKDTELVAALRQMKVNTKSGVCMGCHYENRCSTDGCRLIGIAADRLNEVGVILSIIKGMHTEAKDAEKSLLGTVLALFERYYGHTTGIPRNIVKEANFKDRYDSFDALLHSWGFVQPKKFINDFELCADTAELAKTLRCIDENGYSFSGVTQDASGVYTVFFRRPISE